MLLWKKNETMHIVKYKVVHECEWKNIKRNELGFLEKHDIKSCTKNLPILYNYNRKNFYTILFMLIMKYNSSIYQ